MSDGSRWFTAMELATFNLPQFPRSERAIQLRAAREAWPSRRRQARGGGREYPIAALPPAAQAALLVKLDRVKLERNAGAVPPASAGAGLPIAAPAGETPREIAPPAGATRSATNALAWAQYDRKPGSIKAEAERRLKALATVEQLVESGTRKIAAIEAAAPALGIPVPTLRRWYKLVKQVPRADWLVALAPRWSGRTVTAAMPPAAWDAFKAMYLSQEKRGAAFCYRELGKLAAAEGWRLPALASFVRRLEREIPAPVMTLARRGADALKRAYPAQERDRTAMHALECVVADGRRHDLFVEWPDGTIARPVLLAWQDVYSGALLAWRVDKTESKELVRLSFGDLVERWGIPEAALLDNGRGFASKWITGGMPTRYRFKIRDEDPEGILSLLNVRVHWATPYHGQAKPIERTFAELAQDIDKHPAFDGAWVGNKPETRPEDYDGKAVPLADFLAVAARQVAAHNAREGRRSAVCAGRSFKAVLEESLAAHPPQKATPAQRALWLLAAEGVTARAPDGAVYLGRNRYWCEALARHMGEKLVLRFDPQKLAAPVHVYARDGRYIATADCVEAAGFLDVDSAREHARERKRWMNANKTRLEAERRMSAIEAGARLVALPGPDDATAPETKVIRPAFDVARDAPRSGASGEAALRPIRKVSAAEDAAEIEAGLAVLEEFRRRQAG